MRLAQFAEDTALILRDDAAKWRDRERRKLGWNSGHKVNVPSAESWATAAVFSFLQGLRCLVGELTREKALEEFRVRTSPANPNTARSSLLTRGKTWPIVGLDPVGFHLEDLFVKRLLDSDVAPFEIGEILDPDGEVLREDQAKGAILFGPPGTSKTTLAECVAQSVGWPFIEIHSSDFVSDGVDRIHEKANRVFDLLEELDHCVVLFDEIDELVRSRDRGDVFGRFLTTSMLPKLARLWKARRIVYFVATNHIDYFDSAATRAERFDELLLVPPPEFEVKASELKRLLSIVWKTTEPIELAVTENDVQSALDALLHSLPEQVKAQGVAEEPKAKSKDFDLDFKDNMGLAKFVVLRWDQIRELTERIVNRFPTKTVIGVSELLTALGDIRGEWIGRAGTYAMFDHSKRYSLRDYRARTHSEIEKERGTVIDIRKNFG